MPEGHFNKLSPAEAERLSMLLEEAGEVVQMCGKILRHGYASHHPNGGPDNRALLQGEIDDFRAVLNLMTVSGDVGLTNSVRARLERKLMYSHHQHELMEKLGL